MPLLSNIRRASRIAGQALLDLLYPPACLSCSRRTHDPAVPLCFSCIREIERPEPEVLAATLASLPEEARGALTSAYALWLFDAGGSVQRVLHGLKYHNRPRYGLTLGRLLGRRLKNERPELEPDSIFPIPLHRTRRLERGYNQSAMLARGIADALAAPCREGLLARALPTRSQTGLSRTERWQNVKDVFAVPGSPSLEGAELLLVDDVLTTGSTSAAAALALRAAGAERVDLVTLTYARS